MEAAHPRVDYLPTSETLAPPTAAVGPRDKLQSFTATFALRDRSRLYHKRAVGRYPLAVLAAELLVECYPTDSCS